MKNSLGLEYRSKRGLTLIELLVVITVVIVLFAIVFAISKRVSASAKSAECMNRLRQAGAFITSKATDQHQRIRLFKGGRGSFDYRPYFFLRDEINLPGENYDADYATLSKMMFCPAAPEPGLPHWHCYGANFSNSTIAGATWETKVMEDEQGESANISTLSIPSVENPSRYILLADSCRQDGQQIFRITDSGENLIGLRHGGKANAFFLDGSARSVDQKELGRLGFQNAYDTSDNPPTKVSLPQTQ